MTGVVIIAAKRTAVVPAHGAFRAIEAFDLGAPVIAALIDSAGLSRDDIDEVIFGNALAGGGNVARVAALQADLPQRVAAMTLDTQCCGGLDAIALGAARIASGQARIVIAGGVESFSRAPLRYTRPRGPGETPVYYARPAFTPWPERDPDMIAAAAALAEREDLTRAAQEAFAVDSHRKAMAAQARLSEEIVAVEGAGRDLFTRNLTPQLCARTPVLAGAPAHAVTAATTAIEADGAAALVLVAKEVASGLSDAIEIAGAQSVGGDPMLPGLAPIAATNRLLHRLGWSAEDIAACEIMEAFAAQAMACARGTHVDPARVNLAGGALARGHPIGASGAVLAVRLWHELRRASAGSRGLAMIAAAGGLGSALALRRH